jgi:putative ABC transport system permease protein
MKYLLLIRAALLRNRLRTVLTFLSIVAAFLLFGMLHGVLGGFDALINSMSDERLRVLNRVSFTRWMPIAMQQQIAHIPGVAGVAAYGYFGGYYQDPKNGVGGGAYTMEQLFKVYKELQLPDAQRAAMLRTRTGAVIGADLAARYGWKVGDHITVATPIWRHPDGSNSWSFDVVGIYSLGHSALPANELWMNYGYFSEGGGMKDQASAFVVSLEDPASAARVSREIDALFRSSSTPTLTQTEKAFVQSNLRQVGNIRFMVNAIIAAVLFTLLALTANTMMQSVRSRVAELAVLKTLGYPDMLIGALVVLESLLLCLGAAACGLLLAAWAFPPVFQGLGLAAIPLPLSVVGAGSAIAVILALVSSVPPLWQALRLDVAAALAAH